MNDSGVYWHFPRWAGRRASCCPCSTRLVHPDDSGTHMHSTSRESQTLVPVPTLISSTPTCSRYPTPALPEGAEMGTVARGCGLFFSLLTMGQTCDSIFTRNATGKISIS